MVSLTPQISMMAMTAPAGVRSGIARYAPKSPSRSLTLMDRVFMYGSFVGWAKRSLPTMCVAWARRCAPLPTLYPSGVRSRSAGVDWRRADLPGATMPTPCREHQRRTRAPAERPRRAPVGGLRLERQYRDRSTSRWPALDEEVD